ncbi:MAG: hypothetical protein ACYCOO_09175 [Chitinophagaceae bacterium]
MNSPSSPQARETGVGIREKAMGLNTFRSYLGRRNNTKIQIQRNMESLTHPH